MHHPRAAVYCKTFREDFGRLQALLASYELHSPANVPFLLSVPDEDRALLRSSVAIPQGVSVISDEEYCPGRKITYGWLEQQVCKLSVYKTEFADVYLSVDADAYFFRCPSSCDYQINGKSALVYSQVFSKWEDWNKILHEYALGEASRPEVSVSGGRLDGFADRLLILRERIADASLSPDQRGPFIRELFKGTDVATQPGQILHTHILRRLEKFLDKHGLGLRDAINLAPWEYDWYARFAAADPEIEAVGIPSPILHFASDEAIAHAKGMGATREILERRFVVVQMAARHFDTRTF